MKEVKDNGIESAFALKKEAEFLADSDRPKGSNAIGFTDGIAALMRKDEADALAKCGGDQNLIDAYIKGRQESNRRILQDAWQYELAQRTSAVTKSVDNGIDADVQDMLKEYSLPVSTAMQQAETNVGFNADDKETALTSDTMKSFSDYKAQIEKQIRESTDEGEKKTLAADLKRVEEKVAETVAHIRGDAEHVRDNSAARLKSAMASIYGRMNERAVRKYDELVGFYRNIDPDNAEALARDKVSGMMTSVLTGMIAKGQGGTAETVLKELMGKENRSERFFLSYEDVEKLQGTWAEKQKRDIKIANAERRIALQNAGATEEAILAEASVTADKLFKFRGAEGAMAGDIEKEMARLEEKAKPLLAFDPEKYKKAVDGIRTSFKNAQDKYDFIDKQARDDRGRYTSKNISTALDAIMQKGDSDTVIVDVPDGKGGTTQLEFSKHRAIEYYISLGRTVDQQRFNGEYYKRIERANRAAPWAADFMNRALSGIGRINEKTLGFKTNSSPLQFSMENVVMGAGEGEGGVTAVANGYKVRIVGVDKDNPAEIFFTDENGEQQSFEITSRAGVAAIENAANAYLQRSLNPSPEEFSKVLQRAAALAKANKDEDNVQTWFADNVTKLAGGLSSEGSISNFNSVLSHSEKQYMDAINAPRYSRAADDLVKLATGDANRRYERETKADPNVVRGRVENDLLGQETVYVDPLTGNEVKVSK